MREREAYAPARLMQLIAGKFVTQAISVVAHLRIADLLKNGPRTVSELAQLSNAHEPSLARVLRALAMFGIFEQTGDTYRLTSLSEYLRMDVPGSLADMAILLGEGWHSAAWGELLHAVKTGESAFVKAHSSDIFGWLEAHPNEASTFNRAMSRNSTIAAREIVTSYDFTQYRCVADLGGGHGVLLAAILRTSLDSRGILFDLPGVIGGATPHLTDVLERCETRSGDFFQNVPVDADLYILKHILHDWHDDACLNILANARRAIKPTGRVLIIEHLLGEASARTFARLLDLEMLVATAGGRERTEAEYSRLLSQSGFLLERVVPTRSPLFLLEARPVAQGS